LIHNHGSRKTKGINQRNLDPESPFLWNLKKKHTHTELDVIFNFEIFQWEGTEGSLILKFSKKTLKLRLWTTKSKNHPTLQIMRETSSWRNAKLLYNEIHQAYGLKTFLLGLWTPWAAKCSLKGDWLHTLARRKWFNMCKKDMNIVWLSHHQTLAWDSMRACKIYLHNLLAHAKYIAWSPHPNYKKFQLEELHILLMGYRDYRS
jgi:hypothetical protein